MPCFCAVLHDIRGTHVCPFASMDIQRSSAQHQQRQRLAAVVNKQGYDFSKSVGKIENVKFDFGKSSASVDQTLATLFDTLTVECR